MVCKDYRRVIHDSYVIVCKDYRRGFAKSMVGFRHGRGYGLTVDVCSVEFTPPLLTIYAVTIVAVVLLSLLHRLVVYLVHSNGPYSPFHPPTRNPLPSHCPLPVLLNPFLPPSLQSTMPTAKVNNQWCVNSGIM